jgi:hypothetical protein
MHVAFALGVYVVLLACCGGCQQLDVRWEVDAALKDRAVLVFANDYHEGCRVRATHEDGRQTNSCFLFPKEHLSFEVPPGEYAVEIYAAGGDAAAGRASVKPGHRYFICTKGSLGEG